MLFFHLLPDAVDALGASLHVELQAGGREFLLNGLHKGGDVGVAALLRLVELLFYMVVGIVLQIFQAEVLQFAFQLVKSQLVGQGGIQIGGLHRHLALGFRVGCVLDLAHDVHTVGNHDKNHTHVLGKGH